MQGLFEQLESRRLFSVSWNGLPVPSTTPTPVSHSIARHESVTALQNLVGTYSGMWMSGDSSGDLDVQVDRQTATTLKGFIDVDGLNFYGTAKLKNLGSQSFTLSYSTKGFSGSITARIRRARVAGSFTYKLSGHKFSGTFTLQHVAGLAE